jgi:hypothetical protein
MGLEDQVGEALEALEAPEVLFLLEALVVLEGGVQFLLEALEALEDGVQFLLEGLEARVALVLGALDLVDSSGHGKLEPANRWKTNLCIFCQKTPQSIHFASLGF